MHRSPLILACLAAFPSLAALPAAAECADDGAIATYVADWTAGRPTAALGAEGDMADALCTQEKLVAALASVAGRTVGHKAGLTSAAAQERFGVSEPVRGVLLADMLLADGAEVPVSFGARPLMEADLLLTIGSAEINEATTVAEAMAHIGAVRPFIELPDLAVADGEPITGETLTASNVGARLGVMGAPVAVEDPAAMADALARMTVTLTAADGTVLAESPGSVVLGHPVESLLWLLSKGVRFEEGDLVSVGSIGPLLPPAKAGGRATATYAGLPGDPEVTVRFVE